MKGKKDFTGARINNTLCLEQNIQQSKKKLSSQRAKMFMKEKMVKPLPQDEDARETQLGSDLQAPPRSCSGLFKWCCDQNTSSPCRKQCSRN